MSNLISYKRKYQRNEFLLISDSIKFEFSSYFGNFFEFLGLIIEFVPIITYLNLIDLH